jgi:hypothetical protein
MSNSNGMYNVLNVFKKLLPLNESTAKEVAKEVYDEVEAKGSILEGVSKVEAKLREQFEKSKKADKDYDKDGKVETEKDEVIGSRRKAAGLDEEYEQLKTKQGTIHKVGRYGNEYDVGDDGTKKAKHVPKTGQKGRPKKEKPAEFNAPKGDIFGRTTGKAPKGKGTVVKGKDTYDTVDEGEVVPVKGGSVHKGTYGYQTDVNDDGTKKAKHVPKTGQKGRPKKEREPEFKAPKGDIFGRTTGKAPKGSTGTVIRGKANIDTVDESSLLKQAKRNYNRGAKDANADQVGAGKKIDTMKNSLRHKDVVKYRNVAENRLVLESVNFRKMMDDADMSMNEMLEAINQDIQSYKMSGDMPERLRDFMHLHSHAKKQMEEASVLPQNIPAVQRKAAGQNFPVTMDQVQDTSHNISDPKTLAQNTGRGPAEELDELAKLAGLTMESKRVNENFGEEAAAMQDNHGKINVNTNASSDGSKNINITADGEAAEQLLQMLKIAGLGHGAAAAQAQDTISSGSGVEMCDEPIEIEMDEAEEQYANTPEECYQGVDTIIHQGDDMNREKKQFKKEYPGDNPMAVENIDVVSNMGRDLMAEYQAMKLRK